MGEPAMASEHFAQARAMRCCRRPSFSVREARSETVPNAAVALKKSGAWIRLEISVSLIPMCRGGMVGTVAASVGIGCPSLRHEEPPGLTNEIDRASDDGIHSGRQ